MDKVTSDFDFLVGGFDVVDRRLPNSAMGSSESTEVPATAVGRTYFNGAVSIDETYFPTARFAELSIRLFAPQSGEWTVYRIDSRTGTFRSPLSGRRKDDVCQLCGTENSDRGDVRVRQRWSNVTADSAQWELASSTDDGGSWVTDRLMSFARRADMSGVERSPETVDDFNFLIGEWTVEHRALSRPLDGSDDWREMAGTAASRTYLGGSVSVDEFDFPALASRGLAIRLRNPRTGVWSIYWVSSRDGHLQPPVQGVFDGGVGTFYGDDQHDGRTVRARFIWSDITAESAQWQQAYSTDGGVTWETNWIMRFRRTSRDAAPD